MVLSLLDFVFTFVVVNLLDIDIVVVTLEVNWKTYFKVFQLNILG